MLRTWADVTDEALQAAYGLVRLDASEVGWIERSEREVPRYEGKMKPPLEREPDQPERRPGIFALPT